MGCHRFLFWGAIDCTSSLGETVFKKDAGVLESVQHMTTHQKMYSTL